jgi:hypothetical protein
MDCSESKFDERIKYERLSARHHLRVYRELVDSIIRSSCDTRALLSSYLPDPKVDVLQTECATTSGQDSAAAPTRSRGDRGAEPTSYVSITLHNVGDAPSELNVEEAWLHFGGKTCQFEERVRLDSYSHRPTSDLLPDRISIGAGETLKFEVKTKCAVGPTTGTAQLHIKGLPTDVQVKVSEETTSRS